MSARVNRLGVTFVLIGAALLAMPVNANATFPGHNGPITFARASCLFTANADGSGEAPVLPCTTSAAAPRWSPAGDPIAFQGRFGQIDLVNSDGTNHRPFFFDSGWSTSGHGWSPDGGTLVITWGGCPNQGDCEHGLQTVDLASGHVSTIRSSNTVAGFSTPDWSADGNLIAFSLAGQLHVVRPDGSGLAPLTSSSQGFTNRNPTWSPDAQRLAYESRRSGNHDIYVMNRDGSGDTQLTSDPGADANPIWSPDGTKIMFFSSRGSGGIHVMNADGTGVTYVTAGGNSDWRAIPVNGYPRPKFAQPLDVSLVPAQQQCTSVNRTHGPPLAFGACAPPASESSQLTVGTPDANGRSAKSTGRLVMTTLVGNPSTPLDEADIRLRATITDVRLASDLSDYTSSLEARVTVRITDKDNTPHPGGPGAATVQDTGYSFPIPCAPTDDVSIGSTCAVDTTAEALLPGIAKERGRAIWELGEVAVHDRAGDVFMRQGIFVP